MKKFNVVIKFPNANNAEFDVEIIAKSKSNALRVANEAKNQQGMGMGQVGKIVEIK